MKKWKMIEAKLLLLMLEILNVLRENNSSKMRMTCTEKKND